jgi:DNA-directed RNA polymerase specialized sigma24 family protein
MQESAPKTRWSLDRRTLDNLLYALHPDREQASREYEALRQRLIRFFDWNHTPFPEELADEVLDRLARRLSNRETEILDPAKFAVGIARLLIKENLRENDRREAALVIMAQCTPESRNLELESALREEHIAVLQECLQAIPENSRNLLVRYFGTEGREKIQQRQRLAEEHGISLNALRNRVMRIRSELEKNYRRIFFEKNPPLREIKRQKMSQYDER